MRDGFAPRRHGAQTRLARGLAGEAVARATHGWVATGARACGQSPHRTSHGGRHLWTELMARWDFAEATVTTAIAGPSVYHERDVPKKGVKNLLS